jgi:hypothetical protein
MQEHGMFATDPDHLAGAEERKPYCEKCEAGFIARYFSGANVLDIGCQG